MDCVDASAPCCAWRARAFAAIEDRVRFMHSDLLNWSPDENAYDLIVTHFFLDCFKRNELEKIVSDAGKVGDAKCYLACRGFFDSRLADLHEVHAWLWLRAMYLFFRRRRKSVGESSSVRAVI